MIALTYLFGWFGVMVGIKIFTLGQWTYSTETRRTITLQTELMYHNYWIPCISMV